MKSQLGKGGKFQPFLKWVERKTLETTELWSTCKDHGADPSESCPEAHGGQEVPSQPAQFHQRQVLPDQPTCLPQWSDYISEEAKSCGCHLSGLL